MLLIFETIAICLASFVSATYYRTQPNLYTSSPPNRDEPFLGNGGGFGSGYYPPNPVYGLAGGLVGTYPPPVRIALPVYPPLPTGFQPHFPPPLHTAPSQINPQLLSELVTLLSTKAQLKNLPDFNDEYDGKTQSIAKKWSTLKERVVVIPLDSLKKKYPSKAQSSASGNEGYTVTSLSQKPEEELKKFLIKNRKGGNSVVLSLSSKLSKVMEALTNNAMESGPLLTLEVQQKQSETVPQQTEAKKKKPYAQTPYVPSGYVPTTFVSSDYVPTSYVPNSSHYYKDDDGYPMYSEEEEEEEYRLARSRSINHLSKIGVPLDEKEVSSGGLNLVSSRLPFSKSLSHDTQDQSENNEN